MSTRTVAVVGGGFSGAVLSLKLAVACPQDRILLIERNRRVGVGLAYGACAPQHLLNVPASRMELGLSPCFCDWLQTCGDDLGDALAESDGVFADAYVPRELFGRYVEDSLSQALSTAEGGRFRRLRGEVVRLQVGSARGLVLDDGRQLEADIVVLATGNMRPASPPIPDGFDAQDDPRYVPDPWADDAFDGLESDAPLLLIGSGLTMADVALTIHARGHKGPITAVSRHGWSPLRHARGGAWEPFLAAAAPKTPLAALELVRAELRKAALAGVPWQRVFDAARPDVARVWRGWDEAGRRRFLLHLRTLWDVHRHRMAPSVAETLDLMVEAGRLTYLAARIAELSATREGLVARIALRHGGERVVGPVGRVMNCTGSRSDFDRLESPLYGQLRQRDLISPDRLRLGLKTANCAVLDKSGRASKWLFAIGPLTRPDLWEVTAVPEINAQIDMLVARLSGDTETGAARDSTLDLVFADLGAGI